jgi:hypothetical protein
MAALLDGDALAASPTAARSLDAEPAVGAGGALELHATNEIAAEIARRTIRRALSNERDRLSRAGPDLASIWVYIDPRIGSIRRAVAGLAVGSIRGVGDVP